METIHSSKEFILIFFTEFQVELKLSNIESYFEREMLIQRKTMSEDDETDQFESLETISNQFTYGNFQWTLKLRPQPLLIPTNIVKQNTSWASPIQKVLQQQRMNNIGGQDLDQLGLSATLQRQPNFLNMNNKLQTNNG